ncbi:MAG TPA: hypothetical protein VLF14_10055 [Candidatus Binatia bacterium]|nr:hypothetical protein [Candidatus Binatia bacterium]
MTTVTALEAKNRFGKLLARVARGEEVALPDTTSRLRVSSPRDGGSSARSALR